MDQSIAHDVFVEPVAGLAVNEFWNSSYTLSGTLQNVGTGSSLTAEVEITQTGPFPSTPRGAPVATLPSQSVIVPVGGSEVVSFGTQIQNWHWFNTTTGALEGPTSQFVSYAVSLTVVDEAGNSVTVTPAPLTVKVTVPFAKLLQQESAQTDFDLFVSFSASAAVAASLAALAGAGVVTAELGVALGIAAAVFAADAAGAQTGEQQAAASAMDPPEPSLAFDDVEPFNPSSVVGPSSPETAHIRELLNRQLHVNDACRVLSLTEGRLEGALIAGQREDVDRQLRHYLQVAATAKAAAVHLESVGQKAAKEFADTIAKMIAGLDKPPHGKPGKLHHRPTAPAGVNPHVFHALLTLAESAEPDLIRKVFKEAFESIRKESADLFERLATHVARVIDTVTEDRDRVLRLAGE